MKTLAPAAVLFLLGAAPAHAEQPVPPSCMEPGTTTPTPANRHEISASDYPVLSTVLGEHGTTMLEVVVDVSGKPTGASVIRSSGYARLDDAAKALILQNWLYNPAQRDGKPITCRWKTQVLWHLDESGDSDFSNAWINAVRPGPNDYPAAAKTAHEEGATGIVMIVDENGAIVRAVVAKSSGFPDLDDAALALARASHPAPARLGGKAVKSAIAIVYAWDLEPAP